MPQLCLNCASTVPQQCPNSAQLDYQIATFTTVVIQILTDFMLNHFHFGELSIFIAN